jgi:hypothetical protein
MEAMTEFMVKAVGYREFWSQMRLRMVWPSCGEWTV